MPITIIVPVPPIVATAVVVVTFVAGISALIIITARLLIEGRRPIVAAVVRPVLLLLLASVRLPFAWVATAHGERTVGRRTKKKAHA